MHIKSMKNLCKPKGKLFLRFRQVVMSPPILMVLIFLTTLNPIQAYSAYGQNEKVTLDVKDKPLEAVLYQIESQTSFKFIYSNDELNAAETITLSVQDKPLEEVLNVLFNPRKIEYQIIMDTQIVLKKKADNDPNESLVLQAVTITGTVTDKNGAPLPGASILEKGTNNGTVADIDGHFTLEVSAADAVLKISYLGFIAQEYPLNGKTTINITLEEDVTGLDEVIVVGYGSQKRSNITGAVAEVKGDVLEGRVISSVAGGLQGLIPGLTVTSPSGQPGAGASNMLIRGVNTINSQTSPLILIDGVAGGDINLLNPDDIESVTVLKDAASSAIYGARAANGVILVTTKKGGGEEKVSLNYSNYFGIQTPIATPELVNGREYMTLENEARRARGVAVPYADEAFERYDSGNFPNDYSNTDWVSETYKSHSSQQNHNFNVQGQTDNSSYYLSYGYLEQTGLVVGDPYFSSRNNVRLRLGTKVLDRLTLDANISYVDFYKRDAGGAGTSGVFRLSQRISPLLPVMWQQPTADGGWEDSPYWSYGSVTNPVRTAHESGYTKSKSRTLNGNFKATLDLIDGMYINAQYAYNYYNRDIKDWTATMPRFLADGTPHPANENIRNGIANSHYTTLTQTLLSTFNYDKVIGRHGLKFLAGYSQEWSSMPRLYASRRNILMDGITEIDAGTEDIVNGGTSEEWALRSYFGRINYDFDQKYLFEANLRVDGTSRFSKDNRWGVFPSFSAGWKFTEEAFMDFAKPFLNVGKIRASWGELGNQNISGNYYPYLTEIERQTKAYPIGAKENVGFRQYSLANENIQWETIQMLNIGADFSMLKDRMTLSVDWFKKKNINALLKPIYPSLIGITSSSNLPLENIGAIENKGWEIALGWSDQVGEFRYSINANIADAKNKITDMGSSAASLGDNIRRVGDPVNAYYGYLTNGLAQIDDFEAFDESTGRYTNPTFPVISSYADIIQPGDVIYRDISGEAGQPDGLIDEYDKVVFGDPYPRYSYGIRGFAAWKGFDLSFFLQGVGKVNGYLRDEARHAFINDYSVPKKVHMDRWTPENTDASYPRMYYQPDHNILFSNYWLEDASYLRLKNLQIGYSLPQQLIERIKLSRCRVYFTGENLFTITDYFGGFDPEVRETSGDAYPQVRTMALGVQLGF
ncbi:TonB-linked outer membrane protein, SusC/RagA family [Echinicola vietnamensis DSM 17526]|uniref:TonB-linked outer membrane protein, SusC/RagA family n=2 Tax=Echinicola TaxID=390846 RepID=L0G401_ECHVK|nr:TonB-linked outer membrane protein, SusC/RagA family [Echinicola vietnamensis DSM 17526]